MNISITARKTIVKDQFKEKVEKKLAKLDRFFDSEANALVVVTNERGRETVEVSIDYNGVVFRAEKTTDDRADSLEAVVDLLFKQIVKHKSKLGARMRKSAFEGITADTDTDESEFHIIKSKSFVVAPMDIQEAILRMNLVGHEFFMFQNSQTGEMNVVYRRKNGDYGVIEAKQE